MRTPVSSAPVASRTQRDGDEAAGQRYVLRGHGQPEVDAGGDAVELLGVGGGMVVAAGGLGDRRQPLGVEGRVQLEPVDRDGGSVGRAHADRLDVHTGVLGDRRRGRHRVVAAALVLAVGDQHDGRRAPLAEIGQLTVLADRDRPAGDRAQRAEDGRRERRPAGDPQALYGRLGGGAVRAGR